MQDQSYATDEMQKEATAGAMHELDAWLESHEKTIEVLKERLGPILSVYDSPHAIHTSPEAEPRSALRGRASRLRGLDERLRAIIDDIDL